SAVQVKNVHGVNDQATRLRMAHMPIHRGKTALRREVGDSLSVTCKNNVRENEEGVRTLTPHSFEGSIDSAGLTHLERLKPHPQGAGRDLGFSQLRCVAGIQWVPQNGHPRHRGNNLLEQIELFAHELWCHQRGPCDVSSWPSDGGDESDRDWIND